MALLQERGAGGMHQEDVLRSGLVWVEIGGMRFFKFLKRGVAGYFGLLRSTPISKNLNFRQRTHGLSSGEGRGGVHQEDVLRSGLVWVEIAGLSFSSFLIWGWLVTSVNPHF